MQVQNIEDLNIEHMRKRKVLLALNKYRNDERAAEALGLHERTVGKYKKIYGIQRCPVTRKYSLEPT